LALAAIADRRGWSWVVEDGWMNARRQRQRMDSLAIVGNTYSAIRQQRQRSTEDFFPPVRPNAVRVVIRRVFCPEAELSRTAHLQDSECNEQNDEQLPSRPSVHAGECAAR
jgi:hypothetical protein